MTGNDFVSWVLRSPVHRILSNGMLLITVTGRKTGRKITLPVGYYRENESLWILTSRDRTWWRNLRGGAPVDLLLKRKPVSAFAELELDAKFVVAHMVEYLRHAPHAARPMGIQVEHGKANVEDVERVARDRLFVKIALP